MSNRKEMKSTILARIMSVVIQLRSCLNSMVICDMTLCSSSRQVVSKGWYLSTKLHDFKPQRALNLIFFCHGSFQSHSMTSFPLTSEVTSIQLSYMFVLQKFCSCVWKVSHSERQSSRNEFQASSKMLYLVKFSENHSRLLPFDMWCAACLQTYNSIAQRLILNYKTIKHLLQITQICFNF